MRYVIRTLKLTAMMGLAACLAWAVEPGVWRQAGPDHVWRFPQDLGVHPDYKTEWWYITGHLQPQDTPEAEPLGFQLTFFRVGLTPPDGTEPRTAWDPDDLIMAHAAVTDPATGEHVFSEVIRRTTPFLGGFGAGGDSVLAWCRAPAGTDADWRLEHRDGTFRLHVRDDAAGLRYDLSCTPTRAPVFHGEGGFSPKTAEGNSGSLYFSQTRMAVTGTVYRGETPVPVTGRSWLDREIFTSTLAANQTGWDWLALGLDDGRDLMLYRLRNADGEEDFALGTLALPGGDRRSLPGTDWTLEPLENWTSPHTGSSYPVRWKLTIPGAGLMLLVKAVLPDQENVSGASGIHYWEGSVTIHPWDDPDTRLGRGFVELTGYGEGSRPPV